MTRRYFLVATITPVTVMAASQGFSLTGRLSTTAGTQNAYSLGRELALIADGESIIQRQLRDLSGAVVRLRVERA